MEAIEADALDVEHVREAFFRRTRRSTAILYAALGLAAAGAAGEALVAGPLNAVLGVALGVAVMALLLGASPFLRVSARTARALPVAVGVASGVGGLFLADLRITPFLTGAFAGLMAGWALAIAAIRRRLAHDDELILRQVRLGFFDVD